jgi:inosine-uridine nucleoside N-ribohydrolase
MRFFHALRLSVAMLRTLAFASSFALIAPAMCAQNHEADQVVIDTDIGDDIDDAFAVGYALHTPQFHLLGVTTTFGDTQLRAHLVMHLLQDAHAPAISVAAGAATKPDGPFTQAAYAHADTHTLSSASAVDLILAAARAHPHKVTLVALGPLFNVGAAIDRDPATFRLLKRVVLMGGSIARGYDDDPSGANKPASEWNIRCDPAGARKLLAAGVPVYMMPLDSTQVPLSPALSSKILSQQNGLDHAIAELVREAHKARPILYDPVAMAYADDPSVCPTQPMHIEVDDKGFTRRTAGTSNANVCLKVDEAKFLRLFEQKLTSRR